MNSQEEQKELRIKGIDLLKKSKELLTNIEEIAKKNEIKNIHKLKKRVQAEVDFLDNLLSSDKEISKGHIHCANYYRYIAVYDTIVTQQDVSAVFQMITFEGEFKKQTIEIDVVCRSKLYWIKVKAMNASAIQFIVDGKGSYKDKSVVETAEEMILASKKHFYHFQHPQCVLRFYNGVTDEVRDELVSMGTIVQDVKDFGVIDKEEYTKSVDSLVINLDITTMIVLISDLTNGGSNVVFDDIFLDNQAKEERNDPVLPKLQTVMKGKKIVACKTAVDTFLNICSTVAGKIEAKRAKDLIESLEIVDDSPSERIEELSINSKLKDKHKQIFGTGDKLEALTLTANNNIVCLMKNYGIELNTFVHGARALTEQRVEKIKKK
eukprot:gene9070-1165_t